MTNTDNFEDQNRELDKPRLLKAIELILTNPADIKAATLKLIDQYKAKHGSKKNEEEIQEMVAKKIISNYSYFCCFCRRLHGIDGCCSRVGDGNCNHPVFPFR